MRDKRDKKEERNVMFVWAFMVIFIPIGLFIIVNTSMGWGFKPKFIADNVLIYYGTIIGACLSGAITFMGLVYTLKQNSENLKQQKKDLEENYNKTIENNNKEKYEADIRDAIFNLYNLKASITNLCNLIAKTKINEDIKQIEIIKCIKEIRVYTYKMEYFNDIKVFDNIKIIDEKVEEFINYSTTCGVYNDDSYRAEALKVINEYIDKLKLL